MMSSISNPSTLLQGWGRGHEVGLGLKVSTLNPLANSLHPEAAQKPPATIAYKKELVTSEMGGREQIGFLIMSQEAFLLFVLTLARPGAEWEALWFPAYCS